MRRLEHSTGQTALASSSTDIDLQPTSMKSSSKASKSTAPPAMPQAALLITNNSGIWHWDGNEKLRLIAEEADGTSAR